LTRVAVTQLGLRIVLVVVVVLVLGTGAAAKPHLFPPAARLQKPAYQAGILGITPLPACFFLIPGGAEGGA
jgi:hypothetical protein